MAAFCDNAALKNAPASYLADFAATVKWPLWQCALKSTQSLVLVIVLLDSPHAYATAQADYRLKTFEILVTEIPGSLFLRAFERTPLAPY